MVNVIVRSVRSGDGAGCARAWLDAGRYYAELDPRRFQVPDEDGLIEWFERANAENRPDGVQLVGSVDDDVAGLVVAVFRPAAPDPARQLMSMLCRPHVYVEALVVAEAYRRIGVGTALIGAVESWAAERGAPVVSLGTAIDSPLSLPFYEHLGYVRSSVVLRKAMTPGP